MPTLIVNTDNLTGLSAKLVKMLERRGFGVEDMSHRTTSAPNIVRARLSTLKAQGIVTHDGRWPRTWKLKQEEAAY